MVACRSVGVDAVSRAVVSVGLCSVLMIFFFPARDGLRCAPEFRGPGDVDKVPPSRFAALGGTRVDVPLVRSLRGGGGRGSASHLPGL